jgi:hypothetical protein
MAKLEGVYEHEALSLLAVKKQRKMLSNGRITLEDDLRSGRVPRSDLSDSLRAIIDEISFISCRRRCQKLEIPKTICAGYFPRRTLVQTMPFEVGSPFND